MRDSLCVMCAVHLCNCAAAVYAPVLCYCCCLLSLFLCVCVYACVSCRDMSILAGTSLDRIVTMQTYTGTAVSLLTCKYAIVFRIFHCLSFRLSVFCLSVCLFLFVFFLFVCLLFVNLFAQPQTTPPLLSPTSEGPGRCACE